MEQPNDKTERFHRAVLEAWKSHHLGNPAQACHKINFRLGVEEPAISAQTLRRMHDSPYVPDYEKVILWAQGLGEDIGKWLELAGHHPIRLKPGEALVILEEGVKESDLPEETKEWIRKEIEDIRREVAKEGNLSVT